MLPETISTPVEFTEAERDILRATPLHGDAVEREKRFYRSFLHAMMWLGGRLGDSPAEAHSALFRAARQWLEKHGANEQALEAWSESSPAFKTWIWAQSAYSR